MSAARPSALTYMRYGGLKKIEKVDTSHHKTIDVYNYMGFPSGTKVMTPYGIKAIKDGQVAILDLNGKFYIMNIKDILADTAGIKSDTGLISAFAQKEANAKEEARLKEQSRIDSELEAAGVKYIGRINKDNPELKDNVVIEINGERKECPRKIRDKEQSDVNEFLEWRFEKVSNCWLRWAGSNCDTRLDLSTVLYTKDDYKYKNEILRLLQNDKLKDDTILFY